MVTRSYNQENPFLLTTSKTEKQGNVASKEKESKREKERKSRNVKKK